MGACKSKSAKVDPAINCLQDINTILVGIDNAGKTTLKSVLNGKLSTQTVPTIGFTKPLTKEIMDFKVNIHDVGGGQSYRKAWNEFFPSIHAVIFVIDASDIDRMHEVTSSFQQINTLQHIKDKPILILANKQDLPSAVNESVIAEKIGLPNMTNNSSKICKCVAKTSDGVADPRIEEALEWLISKVSDQYEELNKRVVMDTKEQDEKREKEAIARKDRVAKLKAEREEAAKTGNKVVKQAPNQVKQGDDAIKCTLCKINNAELKHSIAKWKPVCQACVDNATKDPNSTNCKEEATAKDAVVKKHSISARDQSGEPHKKENLDAKNQNPLIETKADGII